MKNYYTKKLKKVIKNDEDLEIGITYEKKTNNNILHEVTFRRGKVKTLTLAKMLETVKKLKDMLDKEFDDWAHSKTSSTFRNVEIMCQKFAALSVAKDIYSLVILLCQIKPTVKDLYHCFWFTAGGTVKEKRLKACNFLLKIYNESLVMLQAQEFVDRIDKSKINSSWVKSTLEKEADITKDLVIVLEKEKKEDEKKDNIIGKKRKERDGDENERNRERKRRNLGKQY
jgi:hypothetical protein